MRRERMWAEKKLARGEKFGLAVEYPTFELLWFDIEWRTREMLEKLVEPIQTRMALDEDQMNQIEIATEKVDNRLDELRETIFNQRGKLDVFE